MDFRLRKKKRKQDFFQAAVVSVLLYECTTWLLTKLIEIKRDGNCTRMLRAILNKSLKQQLTKQFCGHLPPISKIIWVRWTRHVGHCWRSKDEFINDVLHMDPFTWTCQCWPTSKYLPRTALCWHWKQFGKHAGSDGWETDGVSERQGNPC